MDENDPVSHHAVCYLSLLAVDPLPRLFFANLVCYGMLRSESMCYTETLTFSSCCSFATSAKFDIDADFCDGDSPHTIEQTGPCSR
jgi:hypothetical protein